MQITPANAQQSLDTSPTVEELQSFQQRQAAGNYLDTKRMQDLGTPGGTDVAGELQLQELQAQLSRETNPMKAELLEQQVWALASKLVNPGQGEPGTGPSPVQQQQAEPSVNAAEDLISEKGQDSVNNTLQWAADSLSDEVSEALNEVMAANDESTYEAFGAMEQLRSLPQSAIRTDAQVASFDASVAAELEDTYGQAGTDLVTLNAALAAGATTRAKAIQMVMSDPNLRAAAFSAAQSGLIGLAL